MGSKHGINIQLNDKIINNSKEKTCKITLEVISKQNELEAQFDDFTQRTDF